MLSALILVVALLIGAYLAFSRRLTRSTNWQATLTPLASIMGSGFLVSAPLLAGVVGNLAVVSMAALLALAYLVGSAIRFNIRHFEPIERAGHEPAQAVASLSRLVLAGAYFISISFYLQLLAAFLIRTAGIENPMAPVLVSSALLICIGGVGMWRGLDELGLVEEYAVALNLGMIAALLGALAIYNVKLLAAGSWALPNLSPSIDLHDVRILLGLLIVVQGFEASRYLGDEFPAEQRIATMRAAQIISAVIYLVFIGLATVLFHRGLGADVTAIIGMTQPVALVLPILLTIAAIGSQFSAAVADTEGAGGLIEDISKHEIPGRYAYLLILVVTLTLTWGTNVNLIIAYASRAFALYYMLQCCVACLVAWNDEDIKGRGFKLVGFAIAGLMALLVFALGIPTGS
jgi:hypothetical protein